MYTVWLICIERNPISFTPLNWALKAFIFALKDSAEALVLLLSK
ncbi:hypothetical protein [Myroides injenensis]|nr:hypothetical protein [Myroides injenensis]